VNETEIHLSVEELAAYHAGTLPGSEEARVQDHLMGCAECTRTLLDLDALRNGVDPADEAPKAEKDAFWESLRPQLAATPPAPLPFPTRRTAPDRPERRLRIFQLLAATLAAAVVGLALQNVALRRTVGDLSQPDLGAPVRDLSATSNREASTLPVVTLAPEGRFFTLILSPADPRGFQEYEVVLERAAGGEVWRGRGLHKNAVGTFSLTFARRLAGPGDYTLRLLGIEGARREPVGTFSFRVEAPGRPG